MDIIHNFNDYLLNETLKTSNIDITVSKVQSEIHLQRINASVKIDNNKIIIKMNDIMYNHIFGLCLEVINVMMINWFGWFPSKMEMINWSSMTNTTIYNTNKLLTLYKDLNSVSITYEAKYDLVENIPDKLYHVSIQEFENKIVKMGLFPRAGNKLTKHFDRIYVCKTIIGCKNIIPRMQLYFYELKYNNSKFKINDKWILYEIDTHLPNKPIDFKLKLFQDPNYSNGYYLIDNIPNQNIKIIEKEN